MWGNLTNVMGSALEKVQQMQSELENQMDAAVGADGTIKGETAPLRVSDPVLLKVAPPGPVDASAQEDGAESPAGQPDASTPRTKKAARKVKKVPSDSAASGTTNGAGSTATAAISQLAEERAADAARVAAELAALRSKMSAAEAQHSEQAAQWADQQRELDAQMQELRAAHTGDRAAWRTQMEALEAQVARNPQTLAAAVTEMSAEKEQLLQEQREAFERQLLDQAEALGAERGDLQQQLRDLQAQSASSLGHLKSEYEGKLGTMQAQLAARDEVGGGDKQAEAVAAEFNKQIAALHEVMQEKDRGAVENEARVKKMQKVNADLLADLKRQLGEVEQSLRKREKEVSSKDAELAKISAAGSAAAAAEDASRTHLQQLQSDLEAARAQVAQLGRESSATGAEMAKVQEALVARERALGTASQNLSELHQQQQHSEQRIQDLNAEIAAKDAAARLVQGSTAEDEEARKQLQKYQEVYKEQGERLALFEKEGQNLARKQSEMEKVVRKSKADLKAKDAEIQKLKDSKEQLVKAVEQTQDVLKKHESDATSSSKSLSAMQAVSQASADKLARLETELGSKGEEFASQRRALEGAWAETSELKRSVAELKADRDDLRRRIGEGTSKVMETESSRRDIEQREAVLRATSQQLQDSLQRQMQEAAHREERLREEVNEMRKRWQEAVSSRESMASELGNATAPLLRQITSLQESIRAKSEHWQGVEGSLSERAIRAENAAEVAEHKRRLLEDETQALKQQLASTSARLQEAQAQLQAAQSAAERIRRREAQWSEEKVDTDSRLAMEVAQRQSLQSSLRELEIRHKVELQEAQEAAAVLGTQREYEHGKLARDCEQLREELSAAKSSSAFASAQKKRSSSKLAGRPSPRVDGSASPVSQLGLGLEGGYPYQEEGDLSSGISGQDLLSSLPNGEMSFAATEKSQQRSRQRDDDLLAMQLQVRQLEASRNALLEEVNYLSNRNAELEDRSAFLPQVQLEREAQARRVEMLLVLLGEKDEELEGTLADMKEVKHMYRSHMEELIERVSATDVAKTTSTAQGSETQTRLEVSKS